LEQILLAPWHPTTPELLRIPVLRVTSLSTLSCQNYFCKLSSVSQLLSEGDKNSDGVLDFTPGITALRLQPLGHEK
jgi:hypothetical protein